MMPVEMPVFSSHKFKGYTFNFSHPQESQRAVIEPLMRTGRLIKAQLQLDTSHVKVKFGPESSVDDVCAGIDKFDKDFRMEVFSLSSEAELNILLDIQKSGKALLLSGFIRPWNEVQLIRLFEPYGYLEELTCFFGEGSFTKDQVVLVYKYKESKVFCLESIREISLPFLVESFESVNGDNHHLLSCNRDDIISHNRNPDTFHELAPSSEVLPFSKLKKQHSIRPASALPTKNSYKRNRLVNYQIVDNELLRSTLNLQLETSQFNETQSDEASATWVDGFHTLDKGSGKRSSSVVRNTTQKTHFKALIYHDINENQRFLTTYQTIDLNYWATRGPDLEKSFLSNSNQSRGISAESWRARDQSESDRNSEQDKKAEKSNKKKVPSVLIIPLERWPESEPAIEGETLRQEGVQGDSAWFSGCRKPRNIVKAAYKEAHINFFAFPNESPTNSQSQV